MPKFYSRNASSLYFKYSIYIIITYWFYGIHVNNLGKFFIYKFIFNSIKTTKIDCLVTINHRYSSKWSNVSNGSKEIKQHFTSPYSTRLPAELLIEYPCATRSMTLQQKSLCSSKSLQNGTRLSKTASTEGRSRTGTVLSSNDLTEAQRTRNSH